MAAKMPHDDGHRRLLSINNYHYRRGGADIVYLEHAELMKARGWEPGFFSMQHPKNLATPWSRFFIEEIELGRDYALQEKLVKSAKAIYSFEAQRKLRALLQEFRPTVAHLHNIYHHLSPAILPVLHQARIPTVLTAHDLKIACPNYQMLSHGRICERCKGGHYHNVVLQRCVHGSLPASIVVAAEASLHRMIGSYRRYVDRIVVPSRFLLEKLKSWGWEAERFVYIPNYAEVGPAEPDYRVGDGFLYFGRLSPEKGLATLIRAVAKAGVTLRVAGTGAAADEFRTLAEQTGARVEFLGYRSGNDLFDLVRQCRAVVLPSEWYENAPLSVLESFALGTPVIGADIGGIPEMVQPGLSGWLFRSGDSDDLAAVLSKVRSLPDADVAEHGRAGRQLVLSRFTKAHYAAAMESLYAELAGLPPAGDAVTQNVTATTVPSCNTAVRQEQEIRSRP